MDGEEETCGTWGGLCAPVIRIGPFHLKNVGTAKTTAAPYRAATVFPIPYAAFQYRKDGCPVIVVF